MMPAKREPVERFWEKVDQYGPINEDGSHCWLWLASRNTKGYGVFVPVRPSKVVAHRYAYGLLRGAVPDGKQLDHRYTCPKHCVNPDHLRPVTNKQNHENYPPVRANSTTGFRGVSWSKSARGYRVYVTHHGVRHSGGYFKTPKEAEAAAIALRNRLFTHNDADRHIIEETRTT